MLPTLLRECAGYPAFLAPNPAALEGEERRRRAFARFMRHPRKDFAPSPNRTESETSTLEGRSSLGHESDTIAPRTLRTRHRKQPSRLILTAKILPPTVS